MVKPRQPSKWDPLIDHYGTVAKLAEKIGVDVKTVRRWRAGANPHFSHRLTIARLAAFAGVPDPLSDP